MEREGAGGRRNGGWGRNRESERGQGTYIVTKTSGYNTMASGGRLDRQGANKVSATGGQTTNREIRRERD